MPEIAVNKDGDARIPEHKVGAAREVPRMGFCINSRLA